MGWRTIELRMQVSASHMQNITKSQKDPVFNIGETMSRNVTGR